MSQKSIKTNLPTSVSEKPAKLKNPISAYGADFQVDCPWLTRAVMLRRTEAWRVRVARKRKFLNAGLASRTDHDILREVLALASPRRDAGQSAKTLLREFGSFGGVINTSLENLMAVEGISQTQAKALTTISAAVYCAFQKPLADKPVFKESDDLKCYLIARLRHEREHLLTILYLDRELRLISDEPLSRGASHHLVFDSREVIRRCLELDAASFIIVRNYLNGDAHPSPQDISLTEELVRAGSLFRICVVDHVIVAGNEIFSFHQNGLAATLTGQLITSRPHNMTLN